MKKLFAFCAGLLAVLNQTAVTALAAEPDRGCRAAAHQTPLWLCIPFAGLLLCIAVLPSGKWQTESGRRTSRMRRSFCPLLFLIPFAVKYGVPKRPEPGTECIASDYLTFSSLLCGVVLCVR